jgi:xylulokinase
MPAPVLIGIDIGTSAIKVIAFDRGGGTIAEASGGYAVSRPAADRSEADPEVVWARVGELCRACLVRARATGRGEVAAVGVSGLLGYLGLDAAGRPVTPAVLWNDRRGAVLCDELRSRLDARAVFEWAGRPLAPERTICLLLWWRRNQPRLFARMRWVVSVKDYVAWRLTGSLATDWLHAGYTLLFDVRARRWRVDLAERLELPASLLPPARSPGDGLGAVSAAAGEATGLAVGTPVAVGGIDGSLGAIGGGAVDATVCVDVAGTTDSVFAVAERAEIAADSGLVLNCHVVPDRWLVGGPTTTTGAVWAWLVRLLAPQAEASAGHQALLAAAARVPPGAAGLVLFPSFVGERTPGWDSEARGTVWGLELDHGAGHLARAAIEGAAYTVRLCVDAIQANGHAIERVNLVGGSTRSPLIAQIRADVLGRPVHRLPIREASAWGAALLGGLAAGLFDDVRESFSEAGSGAAVHVPDPAARDRYAELYAEFRRVRAAIRRGRIAQHPQGGRAH